MATTKNQTQTTEAAKVEAVNSIPSLADYQSADKDGKRDIRKAVTAIRDAAIDELDMTLAKAAKAALEGYTPASPTKVEVDYQQVVARRIAVLEHAAFLLANGLAVPDGMPEGFEFVQDTKLADDTDLTGDAAKLAVAKLTRSGKRNDIGALVTEAFADKEPGTFLKVSELANMTGGSTFNGRITAHLFPKDESPRETVTYKAVPRTATSPAGAVRI